LPILNKLFRDPRGIFALILVPSREVAMQITEQVSFLGSTNNIRCVCVVGGTDFCQQKLLIENAPHIVVGTPGRLSEHISRSEKMQKYMKNLEFLVMDEADKLLNDTQFPFVKEILDALTTTRPIQRIFCTATVDLEDVSQLKDLTRNKELEVISTHRAIEKARSVTLRYLLTPEQVKDINFVHLLQMFKGNEIIVFTNSCE
jgi:ATP-dependent RNA helicase DDX47/RRP3